MLQFKHETMVKHVGDEKHVWYWKGILSGGEKKQS